MKRSVLITQSALAALLALVLYNSRGALSGCAMYVAALALIECFYAAHVMRRREAAAQCSAIACAAIFALAAWELSAVNLKIANPILLPPPRDVFQAFWDCRGLMARGIFSSLALLCASMAIALAAGVTLGLFTGMSPFLRGVFLPIAKVLSPIPPVIYSPYAVAKLYGYWIVKEYREAYNMFCCSGILFNHESERRGETFVTRKITLAAARIAQGKQDKLYLGNLSSLRDWGYAKDYVECMWLILQNEKPEDFVIATGVQHSVREFCYLAFKYVGIELEFVGEGADEKGIDKATGRVLVEVSPDFYRPTDVVNLWGDPTKAKTRLGWDPMKTTFEQLVKIMVDADMAKVAVERAGDEIRTNLAEYLEKGIVK